MKFLTAKELAARWNCSCGALANRRMYGRQGPSFARVGRTVIYPMKSIAAWERKYPDLLQKK